MSSYFLGGFSAYLMRAVRAPVEPLRMLLDPGMVGRALDREVERDLEAVRVRGRDQPAEIVEACRARDGARRGRPPRCRSHRGCPGSSGAGRQRVVAALAVGPADRMDRREVEHVEAHAPDVGQPRDHVVEGAVAVADRRSASAGTSRTRRRTWRPAGRRRPRARARSVTRWCGCRRGSSARARPPPSMRCSSAPVIVPLRLQLARAAPAAPAGRRPAPARSVRSIRARPSISSRRDVEPGVVLLHHLGAPALEQIAPRLDRVEVAAVAVHREAAAPAVVVDERHRRLAPVRLVLRAVLDARRRSCRGRRRRCRPRPRPRRRRPA